MVTQSRPVLGAESKLKIYLILHLKLPFQKNFQVNRQVRLTTNLGHPMCSCGLGGVEDLWLGVNKMVQIKIKIITVGRDRSNRKSRRAKFSGHNDGH